MCVSGVFALPGMGSSISTWAISGLSSSVYLSTYLSCTHLRWFDFVRVSKRTNRSNRSNTNKETNRPARYTSRALISVGLNRTVWNSRLSLVSLFLPPDPLK